MCAPSSRSRSGSFTARASISTRCTPSQTLTSSKRAAVQSSCAPCRARRGALPVRRDNRAQSDGARSASRGSAPLRPRHRHVPRQPAPVGRHRVPPIRRKRFSKRRQARRRCDGHQGGCSADRGENGPTLLTPGTSRTSHRRVLGRNIRFVLSVPGVHAFCTPGILALLPAVSARGSRRNSDGRGRLAAEAMAATASEPHIFPMPSLARDP